MLDFLLLGVILVAAYLIFRRIIGLRPDNRPYRAGIALAMAVGFLLLWVNAGVGIVGTEDNAINLAYLGVPCVGFVGALLARFRPAGLSKALVATAIAQVAVAVAAVVMRLGVEGPIWPDDVIALTVVFTFLWGVAAWLMRKAARLEAAAS